MSKLYGIDKIKNVALIGHSQTGKTSLIESMLLTSVAIKEKGSLDKGTMTTDYEEEEIERKMSIRSAVAYTEHKGYKINLVDTPGLSDFSVDVRAALRAVESVFALIDAENGVEIQTQKNWKLSSEYKMPKAAIINKMDKERADFDKIMQNIEKSFDNRTIAINLPIGAGENFKGIIDLLSMKAIYPDGNKTKVEDIPEELKAKAEEQRVQMIEVACEVNEELMEKYFAEEKLTDEEIFSGLKAGIKEQNFIPVLCSAGEQNIGSLSILDFIVNMLPSPGDIGEVKGLSEDGGEITRKISEDEPFSAFVFKTMIDPYAGRTSFLKIHSGKLRVGDEIFNPQKQEKTKVGHIYIMKGKNRDEVSEVSAGDIVVLAKLENTLTSDTLCDPANVIMYEPLKIPSPVSFTAVRAESKKDEEKMNNSLYKLIEEDPSFVVKFNKETKQTVIENNGQLQTEIALKKIEKRNNIKIERSVPRVAYRETIRKKTQAHYRHKKQSGGHGQFGEVFIEVSPKPRGEGFEFENNIVGGAIPKNFIPAVEKGVLEAMESGVLAGYPVMDIKVNLYDGKYHDVDSSEMAFKIAGRGAMNDGMEKANPVLLEPIMKAKIYAPDEYTGGIMSDLNSKRARVSGSNVGSDGLTEIEAQVPLAEMLKYSIDLKGITSGEGTFEMEFSHYEELQGREADMVIKAVQELKEENQ
jgi:elongation factor G